jgi:hypothetical protein
LGSKKFTRRLFLRASLVLTGSGLVGPSALVLPRSAGAVQDEAPEVGEVLSLYLGVWRGSEEPLEPLRVWLIIFYELVFRSNLEPHTTLRFFRQAAKTIGLPATNSLTVLAFLKRAFEHAIQRKITTTRRDELEKILHALQRTTHSKFTPEDYQAYKRYRINKLKWLAVTREIDLAFSEGSGAGKIQQLKRKRKRLFRRYIYNRDLYTQLQRQTRLTLLSSLLERGKIRFPAEPLTIADLVNKYPTKVYLERPYKKIIAGFRA